MKADAIAALITSVTTGVVTLITAITALIATWRHGQADAKQFADVHGRIDAVHRKIDGGEPS